MEKESLKIIEKLLSKFEAKIDSQTLELTDLKNKISSLESQVQKNYEQTYTRIQAAEYLKVSLNTLDRMRESKTNPLVSHAIGKRIFFKRSELDRQKKEL